jgi:hypothetical protein
MAYTMIAAYHPSSTQPGERRLATIALVGLLLLGLILRLVVTFAFPSINSPDEIYQTVEQALRLTTGVGIAADFGHDIAGEDVLGVAGSLSD